MIRPSCGLSSCFPALPATHFGRISTFSSRQDLCLVRSVSPTPICCCSILTRYLLPLLLAFICCPYSLPLFVICEPIFGVICVAGYYRCDCSILCLCSCNPPCALFWLELPLSVAIFWVCCLQICSTQLMSPPV